VTWRSCSSPPLGSIKRWYVAFFLYLVVLLFEGELWDVAGEKVYFNPFSSFLSSTRDLWKTTDSARIFQFLGFLSTNFSSHSSFSIYRAYTPCQVGQYIGKGPAEKYPFVRDVLQAYVATFDFKGLPFDASFRRFLEQFRLPGEAQCIDRIMEQVCDCA